MIEVADRSGVVLEELTNGSSSSDLCVRSISRSRTASGEACRATSCKRGHGVGQFDRRDWVPVGPSGPGVDGVDHLAEVEEQIAIELVDAEMIGLDR
jgi:hypothetical protein